VRACLSRWKEDVDLIIRQHTQSIDVVKQSISNAYDKEHLKQVSHLSSNYILQHILLCYSLYCIAKSFIKPIYLIHMFLFSILIIVYYIVIIVNGNKL